MYSDFVFLDRFLFELSCKNTHTHTHKHTHTHRDSNEYPIVAFSKNATIMRFSHLQPGGLRLSSHCKRNSEKALSEFRPALWRQALIQ